MLDIDLVALVFVLVLKVAQFVYVDTRPSDTQVVPDWSNWDGEE